MRPLLLLIVVLGLTGDAVAQQGRRGPRTPAFGGSRQSLFSRRGASGSINDSARSATTEQRFSRGARDVRNFVGADRQDVTGFVGAEQGRTTGNVTSSVTGLREQPPIRVNQPRPAQRSVGRYAPRLIPDETLQARTPTARPNALAPPQRLGQFFAAQSMTGIAVSGTRRSVTLTGTVPTTRDRRIAALIASFEPGVAVVQNRLRVTPAKSQAPPPVPKPATDSNR